jgi:hypothetical protein
MAKKAPYHDNLSNNNLAVFNHAFTLIRFVLIGSSFPVAFPVSDRL